jgi:hypothetical protein
MVFGVCLLGVGALYLVPSMARAPQQVGAPTRPDDAPTVKRSPTSPTAPSTVLATTTAYEEPKPWPSSNAPTSGEEGPEAPESSVAPTADEVDPAEAPEAPEASSTRRTGSTPFVPGPPEDITPPTPVTALELDRASPEQLRLVWAPSTDDSGVVSYRIWLDGYAVRTTVDTTATLDWFNDDNAQHVVQVHAVDAAGNRSLTPATLLVARPTPSPSSRPAGTPARAATTAPPAEPTPSRPTPGDTPSGEPRPSQSPFVAPPTESSSGPPAVPGPSSSEEVTN